MTYLQFHFYFIVPPLILLAAGRPWRRVDGRALRFLLLLALIAFLYATPWDNYLVWRGAWTYDPDRVAGVVGYVPIEEYLFFILQPLLTGCWFYHLMGREGQAHVKQAAPGFGNHVRIAGALSYVVAAVAGAFCLTRPEGTYLGLILVWAAPILAAQWAYSGHRILTYRRSALLGVAVPTLYLCVADAIAIRAGIWRISDAHSFGLELFGLPIEEAVFFLVTNIMVVQGLLLFIAPSPSARSRIDA